MSKDSILFIAVLGIAFAIYYPIMRLARKDMAARTQNGLNSTPILMLLMLPILGPILYLLFRKYFQP